MCGFIGAIRFDGGEIPAIPSAASKRIRWRGPDAYEEQSATGRVLASARLAIIDLDPEADQPITSSDGDWMLLFNGEIYNYRELAATYGLGTKANRSDSWTLIELIARRGVMGAHQDLRGMYSFAAWEVRAERLWLVRDPFGIKPVVWTPTQNGVLFGSDPRSLAIWRGAFGLSVGIDSYALAHYLMLGFVPGDATMWSDIRRCSPGTVTSIDRAGIQIAQWHDPFRSETDSPPYTDEVDAALNTAVSRHLVADVEVGAFLSGGLDSSLVASIATHLVKTPLRTYSVGFDSSILFDESPVAAQMARSLGARHKTLRLGVSDFIDLAEGVVEAFPEPHADAASMPTLALSRRARQDVKVVLTGEGGDEMFGGYRRYWALRLSRGVLTRLAAAGPLGALVSRIGGRRVDQIFSASKSSPAVAYARLLTTLHWDLIAASAGPATNGLPAAALRRYESAELANPDANSMRRFELDQHLPESYLEKGDRATMRCGLEARVPFLDVDLARVAARLTNGQLASLGRTKILLRRLALKYLPASVAEAPKRGLRVPLTEWMAAEPSSKWIRQTLSGGAGVRLGVFDQAGLESTLRRLDGFASEEKADGAYRLVMLELWCRQCIDSGAV